MQVIELRGDESIAVIGNLLESAAAATSKDDAAVSDRSVLLYVPRGCEALENNRVNLTVLRRLADNLVLRLAVVIEDRETRGLARDIGLLVLHSIEQGEKSNLTALDRRRRRHQALPPRPISSILPLRATQASASRQSRARRSVYAGLVIAVLVLGALGFGMLFVLPNATVTLQPQSEPAEASMEMVAVAGLEEIDYGTGQVPARSAQVEREGNDRMATTARIEVPDGYSQGAAVFANKTTIPVTITKGTVVRTSTGDNVRFYTVDDALLPGQLYGTVRVGILAGEPGPKGNVPAFSINVIEGELAAQAGVLNDARTSGGTVRRMGAVDGKDLVDLRARLMKRLQEEAYSELTAALAQSELVPADSLVITILDEAFDHKTGDMADELGLTMRVRVSGLAIDEADGEALVLRLLDQRMKPGFRLLEGSVTSSTNLLLASTEEVRFGMTLRAAIAPEVDTQALSRALAGKGIVEAKQYLSSHFALQAEPAIRLDSSLQQRLPYWPRRIRVQVTTR